MTIRELTPTPAISTRPLFLMLIGRPGSGKGTQAELLVKRLHLPHLCTGELLRAMIRQGTNPRLADLVNRGEILPDHMATSILAERLHENDCASGAILDGCARSIGQAISIGKLLAATGPSLTAALHLMVSEEVAFGHIEARSHIAGLGREDHDPPVTRRRMEVFNEVTTKVLEYYRSEGLLYEVDGSGFPLDVHARIMSALGTTLNEA